MKFLLDENVDSRLDRFLSEQDHDGTAIARHYPSDLGELDDLGLAVRAQREPITGDTDFGGLVFADRRPYVGIVLLRINPGEPLDVRIQRLAFVLAQYREQLEQFLVVTKTRVQVRKQKQDRISRSDAD